MSNLPIFRYFSKGTNATFLCKCLRGGYVLYWGEGWGSFHFFVKISWSCHFSYLVNTRPPLLRQKKTVTLPHSYPSVFYCPTLIFGQIWSGIFGQVMYMLLSAVGIVCSTGMQGFARKMRSLRNPSDMYVYYLQNKPLRHDACSGAHVVISYEGECELVF